MYENKKETEYKLINKAIYNYKFWLMYKWKLIPLWSLKLNYEFHS